MKWPANSPDLNPCDYSVWSELERILHHRKRFQTLEELKEGLIEAWAAYPHEYVNNAIDSFRKRCRDIVSAEGGHIDHYQ